MFFGAMIGLAIANFGWQAFGAHDWSLAIDRTWFQVCAIAAVWMLSSLKTASDAS